VLDQAAGNLNMLRGRDIEKAMRKLYDPSNQLIFSFFLQTAKS
jgi:hypothetical protein